MPDPELPMVTVADLGILRDVEDGSTARVVVTITPTYSGCPALAEIAADLHGALTEAGLDRVTVRTALAPPWSTDWITAEGRRKLAEAAGIAPPGPAPAGRPGAADPLRLARAGQRPLPAVRLRGHRADRRVQRAPRARRCTAAESCGEPFEQVKEL